MLINPEKHCSSLAAGQPKPRPAPSSAPHQPHPLPCSGCQPRLRLLSGSTTGVRGRGSTTAAPTGSRGTPARWLVLSGWERAARYLHPSGGCPCGRRARGGVSGSTAGPSGPPAAPTPGLHSPRAPTKAALPRPTTSLVVVVVVPPPLQPSPACPPPHSVAACPCPPAPRSRPPAPTSS